MNAFPLKVWIARCDDCDWESKEVFDCEDEAEEACGRHDRESHPEDVGTTPAASLRETYQQTLDRLAVAAVRNARSAA